MQLLRWIDASDFSILSKLWRKKKRVEAEDRYGQLRKSIIGLMIIIPVAVFGIFLLPSIMQYLGHPISFNEQHYGMNQEIRGFPTGNVSMTFTSWMYAKSFHGLDPLMVLEPGENATLVVFNFTLRNIANNEIEIRSSLQYGEGADSFTPRPSPLLKYGGYYAQAKHDIPYDQFYGLWEYKYTLLPNQSVKGYIVYEILEGYTPTELVYPSQESPQISIKVG
jgi:hypothetical protein